MSALLFLIDTFSKLYLATFLLRIIMQLVRADFYNPVSQFIVSVTNPLVVPARRILPRARGFDLPTFVVLLVLEIAVTALLLSLGRFPATIPMLLGYSVLQLIRLVVSTYVICIFLMVLLSWVAQSGYTPVAVLLHQICNPLIRPVRRILPPIGGFDLSPAVVLILLYALQIFINQTIAPALL